MTETETPQANAATATPSPKHPIRRWTSRIAKIALLVFVVGVLVLLGIHETVRRPSLARIYTIDEVEPRRVGIVFGAAVNRNGDPQLHLRQRLATALALYNQNKIKKILVSGNDAEKSNYESRVMRNWLIEHGVAPEDVQSDHGGLRTLDTCARAAAVWHLTDEEVVLITQGYHLPRALYLAEQWGQPAIGVAAPYPGYGKRTQARDGMREFMARVLAWVDVNILDTQPKYLGDPETI